MADRGKLPTRRCTVWWHMDHQCYAPATHYAYPSISHLAPLLVCDEHAYEARRSEYRVEPIQAEPEGRT